MPTKPISARARLMAFFATNSIEACEAILEDARAVLAERKRIRSANVAKQTGQTAGATKQAKSKANGQVKSKKGMPKPDATGTLDVATI